MSDRPASAAPAPPAALETRLLVKRYGARVVVRDLSLGVPRGSLYVLLGPNGAGKTTVLRCLLGLTRPSAGEVLVHGLDARRPAARRDLGGMVDAPAFYPNLTGLENLRLMARLRAATPAQVEAALHLTGLGPVARHLTRTYSLGLRQRLGIAMALVGEPSVLALDEPQNGLDPAGMLDMRALLAEVRAQGRTVLVSSHLLGEVAQFATHLGVLCGGRLVFQGAVADFRRLGGSWLEVESRCPAQAEAGLRAAGFAPERSGTALRLEAGTDQGRVARALLDAGLSWQRLQVVERPLEQVYLQLTGAA